MTADGPDAMKPQSAAASIKLGLSTFLPFRLSVLSNTVSRSIAEVYEAEFGLSVWQWRVLAVLAEAGPLTATQICDRTAMDKATVSRTVRALTEASLVTRRALVRDGRSSLLTLTERGQDIYARIVPRAREMETRLTAGLSAADQQQLSDLLTRLARAASPDRPLW